MKKIKKGVTSKLKTQNLSASKKNHNHNNHNHHERIFLSSGIPGLDEALNKGLRKTSSTIIAGSPGSGKSIFALQFLIEGAKKGESGLYITTDETIEAIREYSKTIGMDIEEYERTGMIYIIEQRPSRGRIMTIEAPIKLIQEKKIKRAVLDSLSLFEYVYTSSKEEFRKGVLEFLEDMKTQNVTLIATSERDASSIDNFMYKAEDFLFEGMIVLLKIRKASVFERGIYIEKMRGQHHMLNIYPFKIENTGMRVYTGEMVFALKDDSKKEIKKPGF